MTARRLFSLIGLAAIIAVVVNLAHFARIAQSEEIQIGQVRTYSSWNQRPGWTLDKGFDTSSIKDPKQMHETDWSAWLAARGGLDPETACEVRTYLNKRVDILTCCEAIEVEWVSKWKEAIAQSRQYAAQTNRQPAIILLSTGSVGEAAEIAACLGECTACHIRLYVQRVP